MTVFSLRSARRRTAFLVVAVCAVAVCVVGTASAQDTLPPGVHIGLSYQTTRPSVLVLNVPGAAGDSIRAIVERDLDFGDRVVIVPNPNGDVGRVGAGTSAAVNYALFAKLGAAGVVQCVPTANGLRVMIHDVSKKKAIETLDVVLPAAATVQSPAWRLAIHAVSDRIERTVTGVSGISSTRVAFVRDGQIWEVDQDGANARPVTNGHALSLSPAWSPSGEYLTYSTSTARGWDVVVRNVLTGAVRTLVATPGGLNSTPVFSPDGKSIAYTHGLEGGTDIYVASAFTNGPGEQVTVGRGTDNTQPVYSPDGQRLAFTSSRAGHPEVYITDVDGTNAELLTSYEYGDQAYRASPDWSPDGRTIAYQSRVAGQFQVMTINLRDRSVKQLTSDGINSDPSWAPDSRHVVFTSNRTGSLELFILDVESGRARQLTHGGASRLAAWSRSLPPMP